MKRTKFKCLYRAKNKPAVIVIKRGYVGEYIVDCRPINIGFYYAVKDRKKVYVSVDIETGLALVPKANSLKECEENTKVILMEKGYKTIKKCREKAMAVYQSVYKSKEWNDGKSY